MNSLYRVGKNLFVNLTNACPCDCIFCIRKFSEGYGDAETLWWEKEPTIDEVKAEFAARNDRDIDIGEIVFCGFGEPTERIEEVIELANFFREKGYKTRLNTNGLVRLLHPDFEISRLAALDSVSISLNADDAEEYVRISRPRFGAKAYAELLNFAATAKEHTAVTLSVVGILDPARTENCRAIAEKLGATFRVR